MSSLFNPGKRGILTLLSVVLIIGIPGMIAYADSSSDSYWSEVEVDSLSYVLLQNGGTFYNFGVTCVENDTGYDVVLDDTASDGTTALSDIESVTAYWLYLHSSDVNISGASKVQFSTDLSVTRVSFKLSEGNTDVLTQSLSLNDSGIYESEISTVQSVTASSANRASIIATCDAAAPVSSFSYDFKLFADTSIFTDDMVELIVLVGGIVLLIIGTFSLSFIDLDTPGKAFRAAKRGVKSGYRRLKK